MNTPFPPFRDTAFLREHARSIMAFYHPRCIDHERGGFFQHLRDDGSICDRDTRHLLGSARFVFDYAMASVHFRRPEYLHGLRHGLHFLRERHLDPATDGYAWILGRDGVLDATNHAYGFAFVFLAYACAVKAGLAEAFDWLEETYTTLTRRFWSDRDGLYANEASANWQSVSPYRGQNTNMHLCEAMLAAFEATSETGYLDIAHTLARRVVVDLAARCDGLVWEHYNQYWQVDWDYNHDDPRNPFRPWGFQAGHLTEWAKLLVILERYRPESWMLPRARELFAAAMQYAWDKEYGGLCRGFSPQKTVCDGDKYGWVQAEALTAAALLAQRTGEAEYWDWYDRLWRYAWRRLVDHEHGAWYRVLNRRNKKYDDYKSPIGKTGYHTMAACYEVLRIIER